MLLDSDDNIRLEFVLLTAEVTIECASSATKGILLILIVIVSKVTDKAATHVSMILTGSQ